MLPCLPLRNRAGIWENVCGWWWLGLFRALDSSTPPVSADAGGRGAVCVCGAVQPPSPAQPHSSGRGKRLTRSRGVPGKQLCSAVHSPGMKARGLCLLQAEQVYSYAQFPGAVPKGGSLDSRFTTAVSSACVPCQPYHLNGQRIYIKLQLFFECLLLFIWRQMRGDSSQVM